MVYKKILKSIMDDKKIYNFMKDELILFLSKVFPKDLAKIITEYYNPIPFVKMRHMSLKSVEYIMNKYKDCSNKKGCYLIQNVPYWSIYRVFCKNSKHRKGYNCNFCKKHFRNDDECIVCIHNCTFCYIHEVL